MFDSAYFEKLLGEFADTGGTVTVTVSLQSGLELNVSRLERVAPGYVTVYVYPAGRKQPLRSAARGSDAAEKIQESDLLSISYEAIAYVQVSQRVPTERPEVGFKSA